MNCRKCGKEIKDNEKFCDQCGTPVGEAGTEKKKRKRIIRMVVIAAVVCVTAVIILIFGRKINHSFHKNFLGKEGYYTWVESKAIEKFADSFGSAYQSEILDKMKNEGGIQSSIAGEIGKGAKHFVGLLENADVELSWLQRFQLNTKTALQDTLAYFEIEGSANDKAVATANLTLDLNEEGIFLQIPTLGSKYLSTNVTAVFEKFAGLKEIKEMVSALPRAQQMMPTEADLRSVIEKYGKIAVKNLEIGKIETASTELSVKDVSQECTVIRIEYSEEAVEKAVTALMKEAKKDKELKNTFVSLIGALKALGIQIPVEAEDMWEDYFEDSDKVLDYIEKANLSEISMEVYVDSEADIIGRVLVVGNNRFECLKPYSSGNIGIRWYIQNQTDSMSFEGTGVGDFDDIKGDFKLKCNDVSIADIRMSGFDLEFMKNRKLNGKLAIEVDKELTKMIHQVIDAQLSAIKDGSEGSWFENRTNKKYTEFLNYMKELVSGMVLTSEWKSKKDSVSCKLELSSDEGKLASLDVSSKSTKGSVKKPADSDIVYADTEEDVQKWLSSLKLNKVDSILEEAGAPNSLIKSVQEFIDRWD